MDDAFVILKTKLLNRRIYILGKKQTSYIFTLLNHIAENYMAQSLIWNCHSILKYVTSVRLNIFGLKQILTIAKQLKLQHFDKLYSLVIFVFYFFFSLSVFFFFKYVFLYFQSSSILFPSFINAPAGWWMGWEPFSSGQLASHLIILRWIDLSRPLSRVLSPALF